MVIIKEGDEFMISKSFEVFMKEAPKEQKAWAEMIKELSEASSLDNKTHALCYISSLVASNTYSGLAYHVKMAKKYGATKDEVKSATLLPLSLCGNRVIHALEIALEAFDN